MITNYELRYAAHPVDAKSYDTTRLRKDFLIENLFVKDEVNMVYSMYDRMVVGGAMPTDEALLLEAIDPLKAPYFTTRREVGIFNAGGGNAIVKVDDKTFSLAFKRLCILEVVTEMLSSKAKIRQILQNYISIALWLILHTHVRNSLRLML